MVAPEQSRRPDHVLLREHTVRQRNGVAGVRLAFDVAKDLPTTFIRPADPRSGECFALEEPEKIVNGGRPRTCPAPYGVAYPHRIVQIAPERFLLHRGAG